MTSNIHNTFNFFAPTNGVSHMRPIGSPSFGSNSLLGGLSNILSGLGAALQGLANMIGGNGNNSGSNGGLFNNAGSSNFGTNSASPFFANGSSSASANGAMSPIAGTARIWGDPHFIGADGGQFDVQGEAGKTYNLLSDKGFQMNGTFHKWGNQGATVVGQVGITAGSNYVQVDKNGTAVVNGQELKDGQRIELRNGGYAERNGKDITVKSGEWQVDFQTHGDHINMDIKTDNAVSDGVRPHGLIGQTFDGDGKARNGDKGAGAQGGGAIEKADGTMSKVGDKNTVKSYEVAALWDTTFHNHNSDYAQQGTYHDQARDTMQFAMMMGFSSLFNNMFATNNIFSNFATPNYRF